MRILTGVFAKISLVGTISLMATACLSATDAHRMVEDAGYTDVVLTGEQFFDCWPSSGGVGATMGFTATSLATGRQVKGVVCKTTFTGSSATINLIR